MYSYFLINHKKITYIYSDLPSALDTVICDHIESYSSLESLMFKDIFSSLQKVISTRFSIKINFIIGHLILYQKSINFSTNILHFETPDIL